MIVNDMKSNQIVKSSKSIARFQKIVKILLKHRTYENAVQSNRVSADLMNRGEVKSLLPCVGGECVIGRRGHHGYACEKVPCCGDPDRQGRM